VVMVLLIYQVSKHYYSSIPIALTFSKSLASALSVSYFMHYKHFTNLINCLNHVYLCYKYIRNILQKRDITYSEYYNYKLHKKAYNLPSESLILIHQYTMQDFSCGACQKISKYGLFLKQIV